MIKDECILVDEADNVTGHANKYKSHRWGGGRGSGIGLGGGNAAPVAVQQQ